MSFDKTIAAAISTIETLRARADYLAPTFEKIIHEAESSVGTLDSDSTPFNELAVFYQKKRMAKASGVKAIRELMSDELFNFKRDVGRAVVLMAQALLNKSAISPDISKTRFGELIRMSGLAYYNDDGTTWTKPRIYSQSLYHQLSQRMDDDQEHPLSEPCSWITLDINNPRPSTGLLMQACDAWRQDPLSEELQANVIAEYLRSLIDDTDYKRPLKEMNMGAENSTLDIPVGTSLRSAISSILYPEYADEIIQQFEVVCKRR